MAEFRNFIQRGVTYFSHCMCLNWIKRVKLLSWAMMTVISKAPSQKQKTRSTSWRIYWLLLTIFWLSTDFYWLLLISTDFLLTFYWLSSNFYWLLLAFHWLLLALYPPIAEILKLLPAKQASCQPIYWVCSGDASEIQGNVAMLWCNLMANFRTNASGATSCQNFEPMQIMVAQF